MFIVCTIVDTVRVLPSDLGQEPAAAVSAVLESKYVDRVVPDVGLVVAIYEVHSIEGGFIYPNEGSSTFDVKFSVVVFRPLSGEVIVGKLAKSDKQGVKISIDFFDDISVPGHSLQEGSRFDEAEGLWLWEADGQELFFDLNEPVRFAVKDVVFKPTPTTAQLQSQDSSTACGTPENPYVPMEVIGTMDRDGLGCLSWWSED